TVRGRNGGSFVCENIDGKNRALHPFKAISTDYLSDLCEMHCAIISHSARLASRRMTGADIAKFREFVEVLRKANSPELMTQADMR
ncbi:FadR/GntR family transcriptional regulator, partial [Escherichia coli]